LKQGQVTEIWPEKGQPGNLLSKATESVTDWEPSSAVLTNFQVYC